MAGTRMVCFVCLALLFGKSYAKATNNTTPKEGSGEVNQNMANTTTIFSTSAENINKTKDIQQISKGTKPTSGDTKTNGQTQQSTCTPSTAASNKEVCIFSLPADNQLQLLAIALVMVCFGLLLSTIICSCQVCYLRALLSRLQPRPGDTNLRAVKEKSQSARRDEEPVDGQPTEACLMMSEINTVQEIEENLPENKSEEKKEPEAAESDPNGDVAQGESKEPDEKPPESIYDEVNET